MPEHRIQAPGAFIAEEIDRRGWSQRELAEIIGRPYQLINEIIKGKRSITPDTAVALGAAFGNGPDIWLQRESAFQISRADVDVTSVARRARLYDLAPVKEMERRGWIDKSTNAEELDLQLQRFFGVENLDEEPRLGAVTRKSDAEELLTPSQRAWCFRVRHLAQSLVVGEYRDERLPACKKDLRRLAAYPQEVHKVPQVLTKYGIRFVVVESLPGAKVDGVALWLDTSSPVIGMSLRYDRVDSLWFTLCHELSHIEHRDEAPLDADLTERMEGFAVVRSEMERRANADASDMLIPNRELESFILRVGPLYSKTGIVQFAHRVKIHPGIIVGQLQRRDEIGYSANREMLSKIRDILISTSVTDGWGHSVHKGI